MKRDLERRRNRNINKEGEMTKAKASGYNAKRDLQEAATHVNDAVNKHLLPIVENHKLDDSTRAEIAIATTKLQISLRWLEAWGSETEPIRLY